MRMWSIHHSTKRSLIGKECKTVQDNCKIFLQLLSGSCGHKSNREKMKTAKTYCFTQKEMQECLENRSIEPSKTTWESMCWSCACFLDLFCNCWKGKNIVKMDKTGFVFGSWPNDLMTPQIRQFDISFC